MKINKNVKKILTAASLTLALSACSTVQGANKDTTQVKVSNTQVQPKVNADSVLKQETVKYVGLEDSHSIEVITSNGEHDSFQIANSILSTIDELKEGASIHIKYKDDKGYKTIVKVESPKTSH